MQQHVKRCRCDFSPTPCRGCCLLGSRPCLGQAETARHALAVSRIGSVGVLDLASLDGSGALLIAPTMEAMRCSSLADGISRKW